MLKQFERTYGEILPEGVAKIISAISIKDTDIFLDLGSGLGKVVMQVYLQTNVQKAYGIEIDELLHQQAVAQAKMVGQHKQRFMQFICGDFLDMPLVNANIVLIASPCFGPSTLNALGKLINNTPSIRTVISLRPIVTLTRVIFKKLLRVECSWDTALCYIYEV